jgi:proline iminopeptidase
MFATIDDIRLHYEVEGHGPALMVISFGGSLIYQRTFSAQLREHFTLIFLDLRGSGPSETGDVSAMTLERVLADIDAVRETIGIDRIAVAGHSVHGLIPPAYALRYPAHAWGAVVLNCPPKMLADADWAAIAKPYWETMASVERKALLEQRRGALDDLGQAALPPDQAFIRFYAASSPERFADPTFDPTPLWDGSIFSFAVFEHVNGPMLAGYDPTPSFSELRCPVFIAMGVHDYPVPPLLWHSAIDLLANATYHAFERSGHWPHFEEQELFDRKLITWANAC